MAEKSEKKSVECKDREVACRDSAWNPDNIELTQFIFESVDMQAVTKAILCVVKAFKDTTQDGKNTCALFVCLSVCVFVSMIKPCVTVPVRLKVNTYMDHHGNSRVTHVPKPNFVEGVCLSDTEPTQDPLGLGVIHNRTNGMAPVGNRSFQF